MEKYKAFLEQLLAEFNGIPCLTFDSYNLTKIDAFATCEVPIGILIEFLVTFVFDLSQNAVLTLRSLMRVMKHDS